jgi:hypothetical protein
VKNNESKPTHAAVRGRAMISFVETLKSHQGVVMRRPLIGVISCLTLVLLSTLPAAAQVTTADVAGHVTDPKGLAVAGAKVTVLNPDTGFLREVTTNDSGDFIVYQIPPGT